MQMHRKGYSRYTKELAAHVIHTVLVDVIHGVGVLNMDEMVALYVICCLYNQKYYTPECYISI